MGPECSRYSGNMNITTLVDAHSLGEYQDKLLDLHRRDTELNNNIPESIRQSMENLLMLVNCYYSNKIEGNPTHPKDLMKAYEKGEHKEEMTSSRELNEMLAHLEVQLKERRKTLSPAEVVSQNYIKLIHQEFYENLPVEFRYLRNVEGRVVKDDSGNPFLIEPGVYRQHRVKVGHHEPPEPIEVPPYMAWVEKAYRQDRIFGTNKFLAAAGLHHRLAWIHPFSDGNGRVIRLVTDNYIKLAGFGGYGLWSITRGFARDVDAYYSALARADMVRQGNTDGRGVLSDQGLKEFTQYFIDTALDQVKFFADLIEPQKLNIRIDYYFDMRSKQALPSSGKPLKPLKLVARDIYKTLLQGPKGRDEMAEYLDKDPKTLRPVIKQMVDEKLIEASPRKPMKARLSTESVEFFFPNLW